MLSTSFCDLNVHAGLGLAGQGRRGQAGGQIQLVGHEDVSLERELVSLDLSGDVGDRRARRRARRSPD